MCLISFVAAADLLRASGSVYAGPPVITAVSDAPTLGGPINITGNNLAFDFMTLNNAGVEVCWQCRANFGSCISCACVIVVAQVYFVFYPLFDNCCISDAQVDLTHWSAEYTTVTINGDPCTNVRMLARPVWFQSEGVLTCNAPVGYGTNINIVVSVGYTEPKTVAPIFDVSTAVRAAVLWLHTHKRMGMLTLAVKRDLGWLNDHRRICSRTSLPRSCRCQ